MQIQLGQRGIDFCRVCNSKNMYSVLDLGSQPLANGLVVEAKVHSASQFPLHMYVCLNCGLGQLGEFATPSEIFEDYRYLSSVSKTWLAHGDKFVDKVVTKLNLDNDALIVEVASNDGYLLKKFQKKGFRTLGVEPAKNVAEIANSNGIETISEFMGPGVGDTIREIYGCPSLIPANNVLAHVPDIIGFLSGIKEMMNENSVLTVENPSMLKMLQQNLFDTIYHEHFSYLTVNSVSEATKSIGLEVFDVEFLETHGGSVRYWIAMKGAREVSANVKSAAFEEIESGILQTEIYDQFRDRSRNAIIGFEEFLKTAEAAGRTVFGFGAAAKAAVLLNASNANQSLMPYIVDSSREKQGYFIPGCSIEIVGPETLQLSEVDDLIIFPWNIADEIANDLDRLVEGNVSAWVAIPEMRKLK